MISNILARIILIAGLSLTPCLMARELPVQMPSGLEKIDYFLENNSIVYFSMSQMAGLLGERLSWDEVGLSILFVTDHHRMIFFPGSPYFRMDDSVKNLIYAAKLKDGQLYLPAQTFFPFLDYVRQEYIAWDSGKKSVKVNSEKYNVTDIALSPKANGLLVEIFLNEPKEYELFTSEGNWINVTIPGGKINRRQILSHKSSPLLLDLNAFQFEKSAQISMRFRRNVGKYTHRLQTNPVRIQISLLDTTTAALTPSGPGPVGPDKLIDRVIIDPGHGGTDYGAIGPKSTREKEVVLDIARRLAKLIRKDKLFEAYFTRDKDINVSLKERADMANRSKGDIFVSIHANASIKRGVRGFQVFFLAPAKNDSARAAAQLENAPFLAEKGSTSEEGKDNLSYILSDMIQTEFQAESSDLAAMMEKELRRSVSETSNRGIDQAGFFVLNGAYMPSVLVETAFITNREDEKLLNRKDYREQIASAIYEGLKKFKAKYENK
jgi:N-acetylmuramoyl-L-alanine amidase